MGGCGLRLEFCSLLTRSYRITLCYQAILRSLYAYFMDKPLKEVPHIQVLASAAIFLSFIENIYECICIFEFICTYLNICISGGKIAHTLLVISFRFKAGSNSLDAGAITYYY